jgi:hypothetical protein
MRQKQQLGKDPAEMVVKEIRRATRKHYYAHYYAEEKIPVALDGLRGKDCIAEVYRREGAAQRLLPLVQGPHGSRIEAPDRCHHRPGGYLR